MDRIFMLQPYGKVTNFFYVVITPKPTDAALVTAAWSYAIRYTARGLDLPDHQAAVAMLKQRHPSWEIMETKVIPTAINLAAADQDVAESA
ncbi:MAG: hypothetical protein IPO91_30240 [Chloroflexi bacterium]|jgi:hypothetical protein|uniref:hypothetical protein n=1 Tax=Candidatus Flexifilum breve TaxID=3140694 RepID=UPI003135533E|nr:hypothetical protein [Chloroflexota bacterium]MBK9751023.1 hypothetical protein [Chloroflexota bacterium]